MKITDIIGNENGQSIYLHKEGIFWRAYEYSAFAFVKNIRQYNVKKKFFKILDKEVVFLGFPERALEQVLHVCAKKGFDLNKEDDNLVVITNLAKSDGFLKWKDTIPLIAKQPVKSENATIIEKLAAFPLATKTPLEAQQFLYELQNEINGHL